MHSLEVRSTAMLLSSFGLSDVQTATICGVSRSAVREWRVRPESGARARSSCWRCGQPPGDPPDPGAYAHLLGLYLGDGHIAPVKKTFLLRVFLDDAYPGIKRACTDAILGVTPTVVRHVQQVGCTAVSAYSRHWPCFRSTDLG